MSNVSGGGPPAVSSAVLSTILDDGKDAWPGSWFVCVTGLRSAIGSRRDSTVSFSCLPFFGGQERIFPLP